MKKAIALALVAGVVAVGLGACGGTGGTTTVVTHASRTPQATPVGETQPAPDVNERLAKQFAETDGGKNLATVCRGMDTLGRARTMDIAEKQLAPLIIKEGGDVTTTLGLLLDRC